MKELFIMHFCVQERIGAGCIDSARVELDLCCYLQFFRVYTTVVALGRILRIKKSLIWGSVYKLVLW